jgi:hypothetical protein
MQIENSILASVCDSATISGTVQTSGLYED